MGGGGSGGKEGEECKPEQILIGQIFPHRLLTRVYFASEGKRPAFLFFLFLFFLFFFFNTTKIKRRKLPVQTRVVSQREANGHRDGGVVEGGTGQTVALCLTIIQGRSLAAVLACSRGLNSAPERNTGRRRRFLRYFAGPSFQQITCCRSVRFSAALRPLRP